jgi:ATP-dependent 26S proteasome regulatory subunit
LFKEEEEDEDKSKKEKEENPLSKKEDEEEKKKTKNLEEQLEKENPEPEVKKEPGKYYGTRTDATENSSVTNYGVAVSYFLTRTIFIFSCNRKYVFSIANCLRSFTRFIITRREMKIHNPYESRRKRRV